MRVLVVDDHAVLRQSLTVLLSSQAEIEVVGECATGREAVEQAATLRPDVILMDVTMPDMNGIEATGLIRQSCPECRVLILSSFGDHDLVRRAMASGASGYIIKRSDIAELLFAIKTVLTGNTYLSSDLARDFDVGQLMAEARSGDDRSDLDRLTPREREILQLVAEGRTSREIAEVLYISSKTVEGHRSRLVEKLNLKTRADLVRFAIRAKLISLDDPGTQAGA